MADIPDAKLRKYFSEYQNPDKTKKEVLAIVKIYRGLHVEQDLYVFNDGSQKSLINLSGTVPVNFKEFKNGFQQMLANINGIIPIVFRGLLYNIPICIWLMNTHPHHAPICYVKPTPGMRINVSQVVDETGKIYLPYLHHWSPASTLEILIKVMIETFSNTPPLYSSKKVEPINNGGPISSPYPTQSFMPMPGAHNVTPYPSYPNPSSAYPGYNPNAAASGAGMYPPYPNQPSTSYPSMPNYPAYPTASTYPMPIPNTTLTPPAPITSGGTITDEHIKMSLKSAVEDKIRRKLNEQTDQVNEEIEILRQTESELNQGKFKLQQIFKRIDKEKAELERSITFLREKESELDSILVTLSEKKEIDVDDAVTTTAPIYKQILQTFTEEAATEDTIYYMGEALRRGVIDLELYLKQVRALSRKQFILRALLFKCYKHVSYVR